MLAETLRKEAEQLFDKICEDRRYFHANPGTGFDILNTVSYVKKELAEMGYEPLDCGKAGVTALVGGKKPGKVFLIRGDMDALPIHEETGLSYASDNGKMHACGHDLHTAMLLGAARLLKAHEDEIEGTVKLMFQPAEEIFEGAKNMIDSGLLRNPEVEGAMMLHVMSSMPAPSGMFFVSAPGISAPAADFFEIKVKGKGCHGSTPNAGVDPLSAAAHIVVALQEIHARELGINEQAVLTIGRMQAGSAQNVIPDTAVLAGSIRTFDDDTRAFMKERLTEIAEGTATAFRAKAEVTFGSGCPSLVNDTDVVESILKYGKELLGEERVLSIAELKKGLDSRKSIGMGGSEDFAYVSRQVPAVMVAVAASKPDEEGAVYPQHHPKAQFDEAVMADGSAAYAYMAMRWLEEHK